MTENEKDAQIGKLIRKLMAAEIELAHLNKRKDEFRETIKKWQELPSAGWPPTSGWPSSDDVTSVNEALNKVREDITQAHDELRRLGVDLAALSHRQPA